MSRSRDYQVEDVASVFNEWKLVRSTLGVAATGLGKTVEFSEIIRRVILNKFPRKTRAMVLVNGRELVFQAADRIKEFANLDVEIEMGDYRAQSDSHLLGRAPVIVSTIQTQCSGGDGGGRMAKFDPMEFSLLVLDEADAATSPSFRRAINYYSSNPELKIFGCTATPDRTDEEALGQIFETVAFERDLKWAIENGWLVEPLQKMVHVEGLDFSHIRTTSGDLNGSDLAAIMESEKPVQGMVQAMFETMNSLPEGFLLSSDPSNWKNHLSEKPKRTLAFASSVRHAETLCNIFNRIVPGIAAFVCGKTDDSVRRKINSDFNSGNIPLLCNYGTHAVGFDSPGVEIIANGRPTKSRRLYAQIVGRCTRTLKGTIDGIWSVEERKVAIANSEKPSAIVLDFVGNSGRHKLFCVGDLLGGKVSDEAVERAIAKARKTGRPMKMSEELDEQEEIIKAEREERRLKEEAQRARLTAKAKYTTQIVDPFDVLDIQPVKERGWDSGKTLSEKCRKILQERIGIDPDSIPYAQGMQLVREQLRRWQENLCSFKMAKTLKKYGYDTNVKFDEAKQIIDAIAANGWKRPTQQLK